MDTIYTVVNIYRVCVCFLFKKGKFFLIYLFSTLYSLYFDTYFYSAEHCLFYLYGSSVVVVVAVVVLAMMMLSVVGRQLLLLMIVW